MLRTLIAFSLIGFIVMLAIQADELKIELNPFLTKGAAGFDKTIGAFRQENTNDCFFLSCLVAIAQDKDGRKLLSAVIPEEKKGNFTVVFPNWKKVVVQFDRKLFDSYLLFDPNKKKIGIPITGDMDVKLLEVAADIAWLKNIKTEGLWDDIPMNVFYMFTDAKQTLIFNRGTASKIAIADIDKYKRLPKETVNEINAKDIESVKLEIQKIVEADKDGLSIVLCDYLKYHAVAITEIDFKSNSYTYIDSGKGTSIQQNGNLDVLINQVVAGKYALNSIEIPSISK